ncbi:mitofusin-1 isoform X4 [Esox lucius]|uniref:mitofusin-1 isoform X4 n=1 Tax=Esox lucius TaxID=8010 RepID=UPI001476CBE8|nr:mitofusin-1 isoform X4 [Esox lucius]
MDPGDSSPLMHFVVAKRTINGIFDQLLDYVKEGSEFVEETWHCADLEQVAVEEQCLEIKTCARKLATIRDVLARRQMKVAFFGRSPANVVSNMFVKGVKRTLPVPLAGRTSNGKSTVINAMLRDRVLPSGIGHTTNCFLRVEGTDADEAFLTTEGSDDRKSVKTVNQLAHALHMERNLDSGCLVKVFWPKSKCALLRDDLVIMDSPGTDVTSYLDSWIDKFCLDADVFVLVGNAESTLMNTEKLFFHKVSERISKPNIFILLNRWDASVWEPEYIDEVRKQHMERCVSFLAEELRVVSQAEAPGRIFFVSAKEVLSSRIDSAHGVPETGETSGALAEGFHERLREFQRFERTFEEFISHSAVKTKFEQHTLRAWQITESVKSIMDAINIGSAEKKICSLENREDQKDRLEFVRGQLNCLTDNMNEKIKVITEEVAAKVTMDMAEQIHSLSALVDEFNADFIPTPHALTLYKTQLMKHVEERISKSLTFRCSTGIVGSVQSFQKYMIESVQPLLPPAVQEQLHVHLPSRKFDLTYDLNLATLCNDFKENIDFQFSLGWSSLVTRFIGPRNAKRALTSINQEFQAQNGSSLQNHLVFSMATGVLSLTSRASMTVLVIGGVRSHPPPVWQVWRSMGWRIVALSATLYGLLYLYEKLTWTNASREKALKQQFVEVATQRLRGIIPFTSGNCSQQVHQELATTFARLCQRVDLSEVELEGHIRLLSGRIQKLENVQRRSKSLRHRATDLESQLGAFSAQYLQNQR